jgi:hypothetical protein
MGELGAAAQAQSRGWIVGRKQASRNQFADGDCDGGYETVVQRAQTRDFGEASREASDERRDGYRRAVNAGRQGRRFDPRPAYENVAVEAGFSELLLPRVHRNRDGSTGKAGVGGGDGKGPGGTMTRGLVSEKMTLYHRKARGGVRPGRRIPKKSEPEFQLDLVPGRRGLVSERGAGDASRQFAAGGDERGDLGGVSGRGNLLWEDGETDLGAGERTRAAGVEVSIDSVRPTTRPLFSLMTYP